MNANSQPPEVDEIARLIRLAGMRADAPPDVAARARDAVHTAWRLKVRRRSRRRYLWAGAGLAAAASLILAVGLVLRPGGPAEAGSAIRVQALVGQAWFRPAGPAGGEVSLGIGDAIQPAGEIVTAAGGRVGLTSAGGYSIRLDGDTRAAVISSKRIDLARGALYFDSGSESAEDAGLEVHTPYGIARPVGTQFEVRLAGDSVRVRVRRGSVELTGSAGSRNVAAGHEIEINAQGRETSRAIPSFGPEWAWIEGIRPDFDMDGRPLRALLDWACRERGWTLRFADDKTEQSASEIVLTGTVSGLTVEEALGAVLQTCSMAYRVDEGTLTIRRDP